jgi:hypothetical protein
VSDNAHRAWLSNASRTARKMTAGDRIDVGTCSDLELETWAKAVRTICRQEEVEGGGFAPIVGRLGDPVPVGRTFQPTPAESGEPTIRTADDVTVTIGSRVYNHYDCKWGVIVSIENYPQPDPMKGQNTSTPKEEWSNYWFDLRQDDGTTALLDGARILANPRNQ